MEAKTRIAHTAPRLSREEFRAWAARQPRGRYERVDGRVVAMSPERIGHALVKGRVWRSLDRALLEAGAACVAIPDGATVEIDERTEYEPDVVVTCGETLDLEAVAAPRPVIVVEVTPPSTRAVTPARSSRTTSACPPSSTTSSSVRAGARPSTTPAGTTGLRLES
jgi:Uma2 family endonuclease